MSKTDKNGVVIQDFANNPGSHEYVETEYYFANGERKSRPGRTLDWFAYIQASREQCDLGQIVARYLKGDSSVINVNSPIYGDVASMPRNINEIHDLGDRIQSGYDRLSDEVKSIFGNSFDKFYQAVLDGSVNQKIQAYAAAKVDAAQKEIENQVPPEEGTK